MSAKKKKKKSQRIKQQKHGKKNGELRQQVP